MDPQDECTDYFEQCCQTDLVLDLMTYEPPVAKPVEETCGRKQESGVEFKITNQKDHEAEFGEFPWMAAILRVEHIGEEPLTVFQCGASLIHPSVVLTGEFSQFSRPKTLPFFSCF